VVPRAGLGAAAAAVRHLARRLADQQAPLGTGRKDAAAAGLFDQRVIVGGRIEAEDRELEAVLPAGLAVAAATVATELGKERHHVAGKIDARIFLKTGDDVRDINRLLADADAQLC